MKQVIVLSAHTGILDRRIVAQMNTLADSGREVTFVSTAVSLQGSGLHDRVRVIMAPQGARLQRSLGWVRRATQSLPSGVRSLRRTVRCILGHGRPPPPTEVLVGLAGDMTADVIHCHDLETLPAAVQIRDSIHARSSNQQAPRLIYDSHELFAFQDPSWSYQHYWLAWERRFIKAADAIVAVNSSVATELARIHSIPMPEVVYNSFGVRFPSSGIDRRTARARLGLASESSLPVVLFQGGLTWSRNLKNLVLAFKELQNTAHLAVLGGGPAESGLRDIGRNIRNVSFADWVPPNELLDIVRNVDLGVIPYLGNLCLNDRLCTPNKLFEFIEAQVPVCASDLPELRKIVRGCGIGDVFDMRSPGAIARAIRQALDQAARQQFPGLADPTRTAHLRWPAQVRTLTSLYTRLGV